MAFVAAPQALKARCTFAVSATSGILTLFDGSLRTDTEPNAQTSVVGLETRALVQARSTASPLQHKEIDSHDACLALA
jgi:hypothetical protein